MLCSQEAKLFQVMSTGMKAHLRHGLRSIWRAMMDLLPSRWHIKLDHLRFHGSFPDLKNPKTLSDKIAFRKLNDRDPRMPRLADKISAKEEMAARFGADFIIPTVAVFANETEIDFGALPYPCVIKANHGSSLSVSLLARPENERAIRRKLRGFLRCNYHAIREEWAYSEIPRRLLVEPFMYPSQHGLIDYKFHTFGGRVFAIEVVTDRYTTHTGAVFDPQWNQMPCQIGSPPTPYAIPRPLELEKMLDYAEQVGSGFAYVRVDLYDIGGKAKFGEVTFYPGGGVDVFTPREFDELFGRQWKIPGAGSDLGEQLK